jgi:hypothetical protein
MVHNRGVWCGVRKRTEALETLAWLDSCASVPDRAYQSEIALGRFRKPLLYPSELQAPTGSYRLDSIALGGDLRILFNSWHSFKYFPCGNPGVARMHWSVPGQPRTRETGISPSGVPVSNCAILPLIASA